MKHILTKPVKQFTPNEWVETSAKLTCTKCGQVIFDRWGSWQWLEENFGDERNQHACKPLLEKAAATMKLLRRTVGFTDFAEECRVYNTLLKNQTYL